MAETFRAEVVADLAKYAQAIGTEFPKLTAAGVVKAAIELKKLDIEAERSGKAAAAKVSAAWTSSGASGVTASANVRQGLIGVGHQLSDVASQLTTGTNPFTILIQQGPQMAAGLEQAGGAAAVFKGAAASLLPVLPVVAAGLTAIVTAGALLYGGYQRLYGAQIEQAEVASKQAVAQNALAPIYKDTAQAALDLKVVTGELTQVQADQIKASADALNRWASATKDTRAELARLRMEQDSVTTQFVDVGEAVLAGIPGLGLLRDAYDGLTTTSEELQGQEGALQRAMDKSIVVLGENAEVHRDVIAAKDAHKRSADALRDSLAALNEAMQAENATAAANVDAYRAALADLSAAGRSEATGPEAGHRAQLDAIEAAAAAARAATNDNATALETIDAEMWAARKREAERYYLEVQALRVADAEAAGEAMRAETAAAQEAIEARGRADQEAAIAHDTLARNQATAYASMAGSASTAFALALENIKGISKEQGMVLFQTQKALMTAQAFLLAPAAILQGLAQAGPAGGIAAGLAAGVQVAAVLAAKPPSFRAGTSGAYPDSRRMTMDVEDGEGIAVVSRQGMGKARSEGVGALNAGMAAPQAQIVVKLVLDGRVLASAVVDALRSSPKLRRETRRAAEGA